MKEYKTDAEKKSFYGSGDWNSIRQQALERDNFECQECKKLGRVHVDSKKVKGERKSIELNVHHVYELEDYPKLALTLDNLLTVCIPCHNRIHDKGFKSSKPKWNDERW